MELDADLSSSDLELQAVRLHLADESLLVDNLGLSRPAGRDGAFAPDEPDVARDYGAARPRVLRPLSRTCQRAVRAAALLEAER